MSLRTLVFFALLGAAGLVADSVAAAPWPPVNLTAFTEACRAHPGLQNMASDQGGLPMDQLCTCFAGKLGGVSQADADMLTKDLRDTATPEDRKAYAGYETLSALASTSLDQCMKGDTTPVTAALAPPEPAPEPAVASTDATATPVPEAEPEPQPETQAALPPTAAPIPEPGPPAAQSASTAPTPAGQPHRLSAEATGFLNACVASKPFGGYLTGIKPGDEALQGTLCSCLTGSLVQMVAATDFPLLALDFAEERKAPDAPPESYAAAASAAKEGLRGCMSEAGLKPGF